MMKVCVNTYKRPGQGLQQILRLLKIDGPHANGDTTVVTTLDKSKVWWLLAYWKASLFGRIAAFSEWKSDADCNLVKVGITVNFPSLTHHTLYSYNTLQYWNQGKWHQEVLIWKSNFLKSGIRRFSFLSDFWARPKLTTKS